MSDDFAQTLPTVAAGRAAAVAQLRDLATRLEQLPLDAVAEVLVLLEPTLEDLRRPDSRSNAQHGRSPFRMGIAGISDGVSGRSVAAGSSRTRATSSAVTAR